MNMPNEIDWARLAAYIDGEGMIDIHTHRQWREHLGRTHETMYVRIAIGNTDPRLAQWCQRLFGGNISFNRKDHQHPKWRNILTWYVTSKTAVEIISNCLPYFLLKREQAEIALVFQETVFRVGRSGHTTATLGRRQQLQQQMKHLKRAQQSTVSDKIQEHIQ
jgi:hypothetical protein